MSTPTDPTTPQPKPADAEGLLQRAYWAIIEHHSASIMHPDTCPYCTGAGKELLAEIEREIHRPLPTPHAAEAGEGEEDMTVEPIDTAPKDGTRVEVVWQHSPGFRRTTAVWVGNQWGDFAPKAESRLPQPTHWRPNGLAARHRTVAETGVPNATVFACSQCGCDIHFAPFVGCEKCKPVAQLYRAEAKSAAAETVGTGAGVVTDIRICWLPYQDTPFVCGVINDPESSSGKRDVWLRADGVWTIEEDHEQNHVEVGSWNPPKLRAEKYPTPPAALEAAMRDGALALSSLLLFPAIRGMAAGIRADAERMRVENPLTKGEAALATLNAVLPPAKGGAQG